MYLFHFQGHAAERKLGIISAADPIPFAMTQSLKTIFQRISVKANVPYDQFYKDLTHRECNDELVACTQFMDKVEKSIKKNKERNIKQQVEESSTPQMMGFYFSLGGWVQSKTRKPSFPGIHNLHSLYT